MGRDMHDSDVCFYAMSRKRFNYMCKINHANLSNPFNLVHAFLAVI